MRPSQMNLAHSRAVDESQYGTMSMFNVCVSHVDFDRTARGLRHMLYNYLEQ